MARGKPEKGAKKRFGRPRRPAGRSPKLSDQERQEKLPALLREGAEAFGFPFGFRGDVWTRSRRFFDRRRISFASRQKWNVSVPNVTLGSLMSL